MAETSGKSADGRMFITGRPKIIRNSAKCLTCLEEIESRHRHDFVWCRCGSFAVDGGHDYLKRVGGPYEDTSVVDPRPV